MATVSFDTYREAFAFLFAARALGFVATIATKRVEISGIPTDDVRWGSLSDLLGPYRRFSAAS